LIAAEGVFSVAFGTLPPGINETYAVGRSKGGQARFYKTDDAKRWQKYAALVVGAAAGSRGWKVRSSKYGMFMVFSGSFHDVDAPIKLIIDTVTQKFQLDDFHVTEQSSVRIAEGPPLLAVFFYPCDEVLSWDESGLLDIIPKEV
jgi:Holliday junction resolvase RusA-like endonuclease